MEHVSLNQVDTLILTGGSLQPCRQYLHVMVSAKELLRILLKPLAEG